MQVKQDYYQVLGIAPSAIMEEIQDAYCPLAFQSHPDRNQTSLYSDQTMLDEAYDTLSDPIKRRAYDIPMGYNIALPKFRRGSKVRVNARASPFNGYIGVVDQEPIKGANRFWYMVEIMAHGLPSVARFAEEQLSEVGG